MMQRMGETVSTGKAAEQAKIHPVTLRRWLASKSIRPKVQPSIATPMEGRTLWRWSQADVVRLKAYKAATYRKGRGRKKPAAEAASETKQIILAEKSVTAGDAESRHAESEPKPAPRPRSASRPKARAKRGPRRKQPKELAAILDLVKGHPSGIGRDKIPAAVMERLGLKKLDRETLQSVERSIGELASNGLVQIKAGVVYPA